MSNSQGDIDNETPTGADGDTQDQPQAYDPLAALTVAEIRVASRELGADLVTSVTERTEHYAAALARVLWMHQRRADRTRNPAELWAAIDALTFNELSDQLGQLGATEAVGPTRPQP